MSHSRDPLTPLQQRIRAAAMASGKGLADIADEVPFSQATLRKVGGDNAPLPPGRLEQIARATGAPVEWIEAGWDAVVRGVAGPDDEDGDPYPDPNVELLVRTLARAVEDAESEIGDLQIAHQQLLRRVVALERGARPLVSRRPVSPTR